MMHQTPLGLEQLAVNGDQLMKTLGLTRGPHIGKILQQLLDRVLEDPELNNAETLIAIARTIAESKSKDTGQTGETRQR